MIETASGDECMDKAQIKVWYNWFKDGRSSIESEPCCGRHSTTIRPENEKLVRPAILECRLISVE